MRTCDGGSEGGNGVYSSVLAARHALRGHMLSSVRARREDPILQRRTPRTVAAAARHALSPHCYQRLQRRQVRYTYARPYRIPLQRLARSIFRRRSRESAPQRSALPPRVALVVG